MTQTYHHGALRPALLAAAEAILDRDGIDALTLRAAAREAGVSHAAPSHHFGDITGLLTELAAAGFVRLRQALEKHLAEPDPRTRVQALAHGYVAFARAHPGIFLLMFRSERLDWSSPALATAGVAAFALLTPDQSGPAPATTPQNFETLVLASTRWSLMHGLATLLIDGRLGAMAEKTPDADLERLIEAVIRNGLPA
ncbi:MULTISPECIES: TetR/AcrR family transcriptional regulator [Rhizobium]|uniref:TetR/AcrR family transcriptional regulator n=1 Tax=Rhizobium rhododendri TaxID=2506430 RepID=A0ABY8IKG4_9HYPH|nr:MULTISPECIES: TetR/AcrR family transcriptional regulator [Rhizobium]MBZ5761623.1 TetR/AcrR family transcriptional regulator [Rhizobium sp. VS19-DR96]MBZ5767869.1 TetR/AcrR family transcriptional regulator [Rhizobium sp. VS19-DR129.2]MBZ5773605.1 TetR/AcrR family transcriptional regulator [Rhizobium sp. VS19-DRK62.2]MBZ5786486.1 TetR/AcrR family transcriptional regulator [Rhizobium sp. VS19-DR121]MBZ5802239.1 TetR/AcrR family transcriptional regulator [Rhizobium sp. VS19-DR181]